MAKKYTFYRQDIINLLLNHKSFISKRVQELMGQGVDVACLTYRQTDVWTEEFLDKEMKSSEVSIDSLLDEIDEVINKTHGMTARELAGKIKDNEN